LSVYDAASAIYDALKKPTLGNIGKAFFKSVVAGAELYGKVNPVVGLIFEVADATNLTNYIFSLF
jgi:hypothetical protein